MLVGRLELTVEQAARLLGAPLAVLPTSSRRNIAVMEAATQSVAKGAAWIEPE